MKQTLLCIVLLATSFNLWSASSSVKVLALFSDKALMQINGAQHVMHKGEVIDGVQLLSATGRNAVVRLEDGTEETLKINQSIRSAYKKPDKKKLRVYSNREGMFMLNGKINGRSTRFMIDTGATSVAISSVEADKLGLAYERAPLVKVKTANELVPAWNITLDSVTVGGIRVTQVDAFILNGSLPQPILLGMSFLKHVKMEREGAAMLLQQRY